MVKIVTDSTSDITPEMASELGVMVVPLWVNFGAESYTDRIDLHPAEFYPKLEKSKIFPTTGAPPTGAFAEAYDKLAEETDEILALIISSKLSATYESAIGGLELRKRKDCRVEVIDTLTTLAGQGLLVMIAAEEANRGASLDQILAVIQKSIPKTYTRICFDTLEYLQKGGRVNTAQAFMGSILKINPIVGVVDGVVEGITRTRSREKGIQWLYDFTQGFDNIRALAVEHATTPDEAETFVQRLGSIFPVDNIHRFVFGPVVGAHVGPHAIGIALVEQT